MNTMFDVSKESVMSARIGNAAVDAHAFFIASYKESARNLVCQVSNCNQLNAVQIFQPDVHNCFAGF